MKNFWLEKEEVEAETALKLKIRDELRASMEKEYNFKIQEVMKLMNLAIRAEFVAYDMEKLEKQVAALETENRALRMANLVGIKIADKLAKEQKCH